MGYNSFKKVMSPLITKNLYNFQLYSYYRDRELLRDYKVENFIEDEEKKSIVN